MYLAQNSALWRVLLSCADFIRYFNRPRDPKGTAPPPLNAHIARDIGLSPSEQALLRHRWPSQSTHHPFL